MDNKYMLLKGTLLLTGAGFITKIIGFIYRIFLSQTIGAEGMGIYQLIFPIHTLCFALSVGGIQTAISRFTAARASLKDEQGARDIFVLSGALSTSIALIVSLVLYYNASWFAVHILLEERCTSLLKLMAFSIPMGTLHSCVNGYYYAKKKMSIPAVSQLLEQCARVTVSYGLFLILTEQRLLITPMLAVAGLVGGELVSMLFSLIVIRLETSRLGYRIHTLTNPGNYLKQLLLLAYPLMANRIFMSLLHSLETILIPARLQAGGMNVSESLSIYGVLTGMTMPLIFFPSTITNSVSVMLMPDVARKQASGNRSSIAATISQTIRFCMILGIFSLGIFFFYGNSMGILLFRSQEAGNFLRTLAFLCPFLYLDSTLSSILTGLGKTKAVFVQNISGLGIRIAFVWFAVPSQGIKGYLSGLLASEILTTFLRLTSLYREVHFSFYAVPALLFPAGAMLTAAGCTFPVHHLLDALGLPPLAVLFLDVGTAAFLYLFLLRPLLPSNS